MERKIGEIFEYNGEWYQCVEGGCCKNCDLEENGGCLNNECRREKRKDNKTAIFKKLEKVGEPFTGKVHIQLQRYNIYTKPIIDSAENVGYIDEGNTVAIEIKQNKEDMEEKKLIELLSEKVHNAWMKEKEAQGFSYGKEYDKEKKKHPDMLPYNELKEEVKEYDRATVKAVLQAQKELSADANKLSFKEFNLEAAKSGKPVCTRDGRSVRILCFDAKRKDKKGIIALVPNKDYPELEDLIAYPDNGNYYGGHENDGDLMTLLEKKEGWINIYEDMVIYESKEEAELNASKVRELIATAKVKWEE